MPRGTVGTAIDRRESSASRLRQPYFQAIYAQQLINAGRPEEAGKVIEKGLVVLNLTGERRWEPLIQSVKGDVVSANGDQADTERQYQYALAISREQRALGFELGTTCSLARLWIRQQRSEEARGLLSDIYDRFNEGFETRPLQETKALLDRFS